MKRILLWAGVGVLAVLAAMPCLAATPAPGAPELPAFAGWQKAQSAVLTQVGWGLPASDAAVMAEFGLRSLERDTYARGARKIEVEGLWFGDATGAYGAFTYFRPLNFHAFDLGQAHDLAASGDTRILFTRGPWLIRVQMDQLTAMTASQMRQLAAGLTATVGNANLLLPALPYYLPRQGLVASSVHYVEGPAGFAAACAWLDPLQAGFNKGAEAVVGNYDHQADSADPGSSDTSTQLMLISYPTPQLARTYLASLGKLGGGIEIRRTGPMLVLLHGAAGTSYESLLGAVNYDADVTMVPPPPLPGIEVLPAMVLSIFMLCGLIIAVAIVAGLLTGGLRVLAHRIWPGRFERHAEEQWIRLNLKQ